MIQCIGDLGYIGHFCNTENFRKIENPCSHATARRFFFVVHLVEFLYKEIAMLDGSQIIPIGFTVFHRLLDEFLSFFGQFTEFRDKFYTGFSINGSYPCTDLSNL